MPYYPVEWSEKVLMGIWDSYAKENHFFLLEHTVKLIVRL